MNYLGIDIGGTSVKIGLVNENGEVLKSNNYSVSFDNYNTPIFETVKKSICFKTFVLYFCCTFH